MGSVTRAGLAGAVAATEPSPTTDASRSCGAGPTGFVRSLKLRIPARLRQPARLLPLPSPGIAVSAILGLYWPPHGTELAGLGRHAAARGSRVGSTPVSEPDAQALRGHGRPHRRPFRAWTGSLGTLMSDELTGHQAADRHGIGGLSQPPLRHYRVLVITEHGLQTADCHREARGALACDRRHRLGCVPASLGLDPDVVQGGVRRVIAERVHSVG